jgi:site-specific DNA-methyltransferase (adenine-specific)
VTKKPRAPRNRTLTLTPKEYESYKKCLIQLHAPTDLAEILGKTIHQDLFEAVAFLPEHFVDLLFLDPPYNLSS